MNNHLGKVIGYAAIALGLLIPQVSRAQTGSGSTVLGYGCTASGSYSLSEGGGSSAGGSGAVALGVMAVASGSDSFAFNGTASSSDSMAFLGYATAQNAVAFNGTASGSYSFAVQGTAGATGAIAIGPSSSALGGYSVVIGGGATSSGGTYAVAMGGGNAQAMYAFSMGYGTTANSYGSFVIGEHNLGLNEAGGTPSANSWVYTSGSADPLFEIGDGLSPSSTSDALAVYKDGVVAVHTKLRCAPGGDLSMGSFTAGTAP